MTETKKYKTIAISDQDGGYREKLDYIRELHQRENPDRIQSPLFDRVTGAKGYSDLLKHLIEKEHKKCQKIDGKTKFKHF